MFKLRIINDIGFEFWQDIPELKGKYQASTYGRIKGPRGILSPNKNCRWGYPQFHTSIDGRVKEAKVHRVVAITFIPNPQNLLEVNHKDENKDNNRVENLEWCSHKYNCDYGTRNQRIGDRNSKPKPRTKV